MRFKTILASALSIGALTAASTAQMPSGDQIGTAASSKSKLEIRLAPVVSNLNVSGKQTVVVSGRNLSNTLSGRKLSLPSALAQSKGSKARTVSTAATFVANNSTTLAPGQVVLIGATGGTTTGLVSTFARADTLVVTAPATAASTTLAANPLGSTIERQVFAGDLQRDVPLASRGLTPGMVTGSAGATAIGPNGFPVFLTSGAPQSGTNPIGPNGFPQPVTNGPQGGIQPIGPNGFPNTTVAPFTQTGLTRAGTGRDASTPITTGPATTSGILSGSTAASAVVAAPTTSIGTSGTAGTTASPQ